MMVFFCLIQLALSLAAIYCASAVRFDFDFNWFKIVTYDRCILHLSGAAGELKSRQLLHSTYKMFISSVLVQAAGNLLITISYAKYATDGIGSPGVKTVGNSNSF